MTHEMSTEMSTFPTEDVNPCRTLGCAMQGDPVEVCRDHRCPHRWQREGREDRARREEKDKERMRDEA